MPPPTIHIQQKQLAMLIIGSEDKTPIVNPPISAGVSLLGVSAKILPRFFIGYQRDYKVQA